MRAILRSITLINGTFTAVCNIPLIRKAHGAHTYSQDANKRRMQATDEPQQKAQKAQALRLKIGYEMETDEKESSKQKKLDDLSDTITETLD